jgi:hypothetical protein
LTDIDVGQVYHILHQRGTTYELHKFVVMQFNPAQKSEAMKSVNVMRICVLKIYQLSMYTHSDSKTYNVSDMLSQHGILLFNRTIKDTPLNMGANSIMMELKDGL